MHITIKTYLSFTTLSNAILTLLNFVVFSLQQRLRVQVRTWHSQFSLILLLLLEVNTIFFKLLLCLHFTQLQLVPATLWTFGAIPNKMLLQASSWAKLKSICKVNHWVILTNSRHGQIHQNEFLFERNWCGQGLIIECILNVREKLGRVVSKICGRLLVNIL